jgi:hypothetical protein
MGVSMEKSSVRRARVRGKEGVRSSSGSSRAGDGDGVAGTALTSVFSSGSAPGRGFGMSSRWLHLRHVALFTGLTSLSSGIL